MSIRKRKWATRLGEVREAWVVDYYDADGDRHVETFATKKDATARHAQILIDVGQGAHIAPSKSVTIKQAAASWLTAAEFAWVGAFNSRAIQATC